MPALPASAADLTRLGWEDIKVYYDELATREVDAGGIEAWLTDWAQFEDLLAEAREWTYFDYTCDTSDTDRERLNLKFQTEIEPNAAEQRVRLSRRLLASGFSRPDLEESIRRFRTTEEIFREENVPLIASIERLSSDYEKITGAMTARWNGEELPLPRLRPFMLDPDRQVRERAWRLHRRPYIERRDELAELFGNQYRLRQQVARKAGFANFRDYAHVEKHRYDYAPADCYAFHEAVLERVVPAAERILAKHREQLGVDTLRPWDVGVDAFGRPPLRPFESGGELIERAGNIFDRLDPELGRRFRVMRDDGLLDLESRKGKAPGGYMTDLPVSKRPLIFMNAAGVADDVVTLTHESGHAFQGFEQFERNLVFCQRWPGMEMGEVGSMAMELLSAPYWGRETGGYYSVEDYRRARIDHLQRIILFFPHCATVDAFQHWIYTEPEGEDADARDEKWLELRRQFETGVDYSDLRDEWVARWYQQVHFFEVPFYYIEYGIAQLGALQIWRNALKDQQTAVAAYRRALGLGSTRPLPELFAAAGIKLAFDAATIGEMVELVEEELARLER